MEIEIVKKSNHRFIDEIVSKTNKCFREHPFINNTFVLPKHIKIEISIELSQKTSINHSDYLGIGLIKIIFDEFDLYLSTGNGISFDTDPMSPNIDKIIYHELGHFVDARLNLSFGYEDDLRPKEKTIKSIHHNLWDSYIDGRLGVCAPFSLEKRKADAPRVDPCYIEKAWNGKFNTYKSIVTTAKEIANCIEFGR